jgi:hypothetical protein
MPRQQFVKSRSRMAGDAAQYVGKPSLWIDAIDTP